MLVLFQSPYGVKVGCNQNDSIILTAFEKGFNHLTELKLVATASGREIFVLNAIPIFFPLCEMSYTHRYHHSITFFTNPSQKRSDNASLQPIIIIQETALLVKLFRYDLQNIKTQISFRYILFTIILLKKCESPTDIKVQ